jgi:hypothetical protein
MRRTLTSRWANPEEEEKMDEAPEHDKATSPGEHPGTGEGTPHEQEEKTPKKELLPSEMTYAELRECVFNRGGRGSTELQEKWLRQRAEEERAQRLAEELATKEQEVTDEDLSDQEDDDEEEKPEPKPDKIIRQLRRKSRTDGGAYREGLISRRQRDQKGSVC